MSNYPSDISSNHPNFTGPKDSDCCPLCEREFSDDRRPMDDIFSEYDVKHFPNFFSAGDGCTECTRERAAELALHWLTDDGEHNEDVADVLAASLGLKLVPANEGG